MYQSINGRNEDVRAQLDRIAGDARSRLEALQKMESVLAREAGTAVLRYRLEPIAGAGSDSSITELLESREYPLRAMYSAAVTRNRRRNGTLVACFGTWATEALELQVWTRYAAEALGRVRDTAVYGRQEAA